MKDNKPAPSTFDRLMGNKNFKKEFDLEYNDLLLTELLIASRESEDILEKGQQRISLSA